MNHANLVKANARATDDFAANVKRAKANAKEWLRRAHVALDANNYELFKNLAERAGQEVAALQ